MNPKIYGLGDQPRPFLAKGSRAERCNHCLLRVEYCICSQKTQAEASCEIWLVLHRKEFYKPTNTGRLIADVLPGQAKLFHWDRVEPDPSLLEHLDDVGYQPYLIFPDDGAGYENRIVAHYESSRDAEKIPAFILLDGTWRQARRMFRLSDFFKHLPVLPIKSVQVSGYQLRQSPSDLHLCTAEVGIEVLKLNQDLKAAEALDQYFSLFNRRYALSRRSLPLSGEKQEQSDKHPKNGIRLKRCEEPDL